METKTYILNSFCVLFACAIKLSLQTIESDFYGDWKTFDVNNIQI